MYKFLKRKFLKNLINKDRIKFFAYSVHKNPQKTIQDKPISCVKYLDMSCLYVKSPADIAISDFIFLLPVFISDVFNAPGK